MFGECVRSAEQRAEQVCARSARHEEMKVSVWVVSGHRLSVRGCFGRCELRLRWN